MTADRKARAPLQAASTAAVLLAVLALVAAGLAVAAYNESLFRAQATREAQVQADILAASVTAALAFEDEGAAQEYLNALRANPQVEAAAVYAARGPRLAGYRREPSETLPASAPQGGVLNRGGQVVVTAPVSRARTLLGSVYLRTEAEPLARQGLRYAAIGLLGVMAALVTVILGAANVGQRRGNKALGESNDALLLQIQQREKAEEALRQGQKMEAMGQLTGGVAHDFNNLLMVASSGLELLDRTDDPKRRETLKTAVRQALDRGADLTRQLLTFARRSPLRSEVVDPGQQVEGVAVLLERSLREDIAVRLEIDSGLWPVEVDPTQLEVAVLNIAFNARDAMPAGGVIILTVRNRPGLSIEGMNGDFVELAVTDNGAGMSPETVRRVFEPFFTTKGVGKGTGLGLSQVYGFAKASGGAVGIVSQPGAGTTVSLYFPYASKPTVLEAERPRPPADLPASGSILMVEDDDTVAAAVEAMLVELGYTVERAGDAGAALARLQQDPAFDIVFSDMVMPGPMNGAALAQEIRRRWPALPVVLTTGFSEAAEAAAQQGLRLIPKPYRMETLATELAAARAGKKT